MTGTTSTGFEFAVDANAFDDMRVIDIMSASMSPNASNIERISGMTKIGDVVLGADQKERLYAHIAQNNGGRIPMAVYEAELTEIMNASAGKSAEKN